MCQKNTQLQVCAVHQIFHVKKYELNTDYSPEIPHGWMIKESYNELYTVVENLKTKYKMHIQYLSCENVGENVAFKKACKQERVGMEFEFTVLHIP